MKNPKYSFIIPVYNGEKTLARTIKSVQKQSLKDFELIVVDNASTDRTAEIAKQFRCHYVFCKKKGRSRARNFGAEVALGEYLAFVDADVELNSRWLTEVDRYLLRFNLDALATKIIPYRRNNSLLNQFRYLHGMVKTDGTFLNICRRDSAFPLINTAACVYSRESFKEVGGFDEKLIRHEDLDLSMRLFGRGYFLGATRKATSTVRFEPEANHALAPLAAYLKRSYEVGNFSILPVPLWRSVDFRVVRKVLAENHRTIKKIAMAALALGVETAAFAGRIKSVQKNGRMSNLQPKFGPKTLRTSFRLKGHTYALSKMLNFIFVDDSVFLMAGPLTSTKLKRKYAGVIWELFENEKVTVQTADKLLKMGIFEPIGGIHAG